VDAPGQGENSHLLPGFTVVGPDNAPISSNARPGTSLALSPSVVSTPTQEHELDADDVNVGRAVITSGLVTPGDVLDALEEQGREKARGRKVKLVQILLRSRKITRDMAQTLAEARDGSFEQDTTPRHLPTLKLSSNSWRVTRESPRPARKTGEAPALAPSEDQATLELARAEPSSADELGIVIPPKPPAPTVTPPGGMPRAGFKMGPWFLEEELGRGGMGIIFKARHETTEQLAAVKVLRDPTRPNLVERFTRETEVVRRLQHESIVRILDSGLAGYCPWFAMELVSGKPLSRLIRTSALDARRAVIVLAVVARAVHYAHETGVLHRDLKPANVLIAHDGTVKVTDFGLAKLEDDERNLTRPGAPIGTPAYMSPEQALGGPVDRRTDVFALGVMLFESVSGRLPWTPERLAALYAGGRVTLPRMRKGDAALEAIVARATERRPDDRFPSAAAFAQELDDWLAGCTPASSRFVAQLRRIRRLPRPAELAAAALGGALLVSVMSAIVLEKRALSPAPLPRAPLEEPEKPERSAPAPAPVAVPAPAPVAVPAPVPDVVPPPPAPVPSHSVTAVVAVAGPRLPDDAPVTTQDSPAEAAVSRLRTGRTNLLRVLAQLHDYDSFDESAITLRFKWTRKRVPLVTLDPGILKAALPTPDERANVALYLRARGVTALAAALEK